MDGGWFEGWPGGRAAAERRLGNAVGRPWGRRARDAVPAPPPPPCLPPTQLAAVAPTVLLLEGGYNLEATAAGVEACARVLLGERPPRLAPGAGAPCQVALLALGEVVRVQAPFWRCLRGLGPGGGGGWVGLGGA